MSRYTITVKCIIDEHDHKHQYRGKPFINTNIKKFR